METVKQSERRMLRNNVNCRRQPCRKESCSCGASYCREMKKRAFFVKRGSLLKGSCRCVMQCLVSFSLSSFSCLAVASLFRERDCASLTVQKGPHTHAFSPPSTTFFPLSLSHTHALIFLSPLLMTPPFSQITTSFQKFHSSPLFLFSFPSSHIILIFLDT